eukprot:TRINITY_DN29267_c0_g2_i1.p1 TRINITY_DN29267_c0_g2~~TRINITY_DN29267_c0_g2_i1.p1  ORF type:complete len:516 (-),score=73.58 TRINITY_DN29267_c0_g2_i1:19-1467(-)
MSADDVTDKDLLADHSALKTCGMNDEIASGALDLLNAALSTGTMSLRRKNLSEDTLTKMLKVIGRYATMKGLLPTRVSALPIKIFDLSENALFTHLGASESAASGKSTIKRRVETVQFVVQFVRVSTEAQIVRLEDCGLQGLSHDKDDLVEQEIIRLVKKFGVAKQSRYTSEVSLAGNRFEGDFLKKIVEGAYWERIRHPHKDAMPKLKLDMSRNRIGDAERVIEELRAGRTAGGPIDVAMTTDPEEVRTKALILADVGDQRDRESPPRDADRRPLLEHVRPERARAGRGSSPRPRRHSRSASPRGGRQRSPSSSFSRRRSPSYRACCRGETGDARHRDDRQGGDDAGDRAEDDRGGNENGAVSRNGKRDVGRGNRDESRSPSRGRDGRNARRKDQGGRCARSESRDSRSDSRWSRGRSRSRSHSCSGRRRRRRGGYTGGGGGGGRHKRGGGGRRRERSMSDSRSARGGRRGSRGGGGRRRR